VVTLQAPFAGPRFTLAVDARADAVPKLTAGEKPVELAEVSKPLDLCPGKWTRDKAGLILCFDLPKGRSRLEV
jgi:hypothetical protein